MWRWAFISELIIPRPAALRGSRRLFAARGPGAFCPDDSPTTAARCHDNSPVSGCHVKRPLTPPRHTEGVLRVPLTQPTGRHATYDITAPCDVTRPYDITGFCDTAVTSLTHMRSPRAGLQIGPLRAAPGPPRGLCMGCRPLPSPPWRARALPHVIAPLPRAEGARERLGRGGRLPPNAWSLLIGRPVQPIGSGHLGRKRSGAPPPPASGRVANGSGSSAGSGQWGGEEGGTKGCERIKGGSCRRPLRSAGRRRAGRECVSVAGLWDRRHEPPLPPATARCRPGGDGGRARPVLPGGVLGWR